MLKMDQQLLERKEIALKATWACFCLYEQWQELSKSQHYMKVTRFSCGPISFFLGHAVKDTVCV